MKANELMIGDICKFSKGKYPYNRGEVYVIKSPECLYLHDKLEGIPLTAEIFEKNGFMDIDTLGAEVCCGHDIYYKSGDGYGFNVVEIMRPFHYVHELQHALRLCDMTDLADNFKV